MKHPAVIRVHRDKRIEICTSHANAAEAMTDSENSGYDVIGGICENCRVKALEAKNELTISRKLESYYEKPSR